jgi:type III pantothenate kinase
MMMLLIDAGNTRIKWSIVQGKDWLRSGVLPVAQAYELSRHLAGHCDPSTGPGQALPGIDLHDIGQVWVSNVAGEEVAQHIRNVEVNRNAQLHFVVAQQEQCGVRNGYSRAGQLGSDRWAALLGAWNLVRGECLVVNCGTATTIDALSEQGEFTGGLILPGFELMQSSLVTTTAMLAPGRYEKLLSGHPGEYVPFPKNTADAMFSGAVQASCGAIQRQHALLGNDSAPVVLSGGAAGALREHIRMPLRIVENLILHGLLIIAQEAGGT